MKIIVHTPFTLTRDDGSKVQYGLGEHDMPEADAVHWYTRLFAEASKIEAEVKAVAAKVRAKA